MLQHVYSTTFHTSISKQTTKTINGTVPRSKNCCLHLPLYQIWYLGITTFEILMFCTHHYTKYWVFVFTGGARGGGLCCKCAKKNASTAVALELRCIVPVLYCIALYY